MYETQFFHFDYRGLKIYGDRNVADFSHRRSFAKKPKLGLRDTISKRIWKKSKGKRVYGKLIWFHKPIAYIMNMHGEFICIVSFETFTKIKEGSCNPKMLDAAYKRAVKDAKKHYKNKP
jgi:hypothetical protein